MSEPPVARRNRYLNDQLSWSLGRGPTAQIVSVVKQRAPHLTTRIQYRAHVALNVTFNAPFVPHSLPLSIPHKTHAFETT
jgi:hypothetical protein